MTHYSLFFLQPDVRGRTDDADEQSGDLGSIGKKV
jgi:hypothetical protein